MNVELSNVTMAYLVLELRPDLEGSFVNKVQQLQNGWLKIRVHTKEGGKSLVIADSCMFFTGYSLPAIHNASGFSAVLKKHLYNKRIVEVRQHGTERIAEICFEGSRIVLEFFAKGNALLVGEDGKIIAVKRTEKWKDRTLKKGFDYKYPASKPAPADISLEQMQKIVCSEKPVSEMVKQTAIPPIVAEALLGGKNEARKGAEAQGLLEKAREIFAVDAKKCRPIARKKGEEIVLLPFKIAGIPEEECEKIESLSGFLDKALVSEGLTTGRHTLKAPAKKAEIIAAFAGQEKGRISGEKVKLEREILALKHSLGEQAEAKKRLEEEAKDNQRKGETIYENFTKLSEEVELLKRLVDGGKTKEEIMYSAKSLPLAVKDISLKEKTAEIEI